MDVILDSNIFLSDIRRESISFNNLFDYLRRTKSKLVIPHLVLEEVVHRHAEHLYSEGKKALKAIENFNRLVLKKNNRVPFSVPNPKQVRSLIRKTFSDFPKGVNVELCKELGNIDIQELYLRGVARKRPANINGEELRDVILWMIAIQYSVTTKRDTVFITHDGGFWDGEDLHEQIQHDIENSKAPLTVFPTVDAFIKQSAPPPRQAPLEEIQQIFDLKTLHKDLISGLSAAYRKTYSADKLSWDLGDFKLTSAVIYDIDPQTAFAELAYIVEAFVESMTWVYPMAGPRVDPFEQRLKLRAPNPFRHPPVGFKRFDQPLNPPFGTPQLVTEPKTITDLYLVTANVRVLLRLFNKNVSGAEIDSVSITNRQEIGPAAVAPKSTA